MLSSAAKEGRSAKETLFAISCGMAQKTIHIRKKSDDGLGLSIDSAPPDPDYPPNSRNQGLFHDPHYYSSCNCRPDGGL